MASAEDIHAIQDALHRYCRGIDRCDIDLVRSAYHPDAVDDHGNFRGTGWDFAAWAIERLERVAQVTTHALSNISVDLDGDGAHVESYFVGTHVLDGGTTIHQYHGRYVDRFERRADEWRIARRQVVHDWNETRAVVPSQDPGDERFTHGRRDRHDPVYGGG